MKDSNFLITSNHVLPHSALIMILTQPFYSHTNMLLYYCTLSSSVDILFVALGPTRPPVQRVSGVKRPGHEAHHSPPPGADVKNGATIPVPPLPHMSSWHGAY
jgi:hypothetical protein